MLDFYDVLPDAACVPSRPHDRVALRNLPQILRTLRWGARPYMNLNWCSVNNHECSSWLFQRANITKRLPPVATIMARFWKVTLGKFLGDLPPVIEFYCCAQFVATREAIQRNPRELYQRLYNWMSQPHVNSYESSRLMEYTWGYLLGQPLENVKEHVGPCDVFYPCTGCTDVACPDI